MLLFLEKSPVKKLCFLETFYVASYCDNVMYIYNIVEHSCFGVCAGLEIPQSTNSKCPGALYFCSAFPKIEYKFKFSSQIEVPLYQRNVGTKYKKKGVEFLLPNHTKE